MKYTIEVKSDGKKEILDHNNLVVELSTVKNLKLLGVLLKAIALTKKFSTLMTQGGATGIFKEGFTQYELSGAKLYADIVVNGSMKSFPFYKGKFYSPNNKRYTYKQMVEGQAEFRAVI